MPDYSTGGLVGKIPAGEYRQGFRQRFIHSNPFFHWNFQRICILTTPIWSGFRGYRVKLWTVDPKTRNYLGIYEWAGGRNAQSYVVWLACLLLPLSTRGSVWYEMRPDEKLSEYLSAHRQ
jgi:hypothetical protein